MNRVIRFSQTSLVNVNNCTVMCIRFDGESASRPTPRRRTKPQEPRSPPAARQQVVARPPDSPWRQDVSCGDRDRRRGLTTPALTALLRSVQDSFGRLTLFAHNVHVACGLTRVHRQDAFRPVRPRRRKKIVVAPAASGDRGQPTFVGRESRGDDDRNADSDYEVLLFCRSPYRTTQPLRTSIPTRDLWY